MADYDLSTYAGRQAARDAGNWVGTDSSGKIVMESSSGGGGGGTSTAPAPATGGGATGTVTPLGGDLYQTVNGPKTLAQMGNELMAAGWPGATSYQQAGVNQEIIDAYQRTAQGPASGAAAAPGVPGMPTPNVPMANLDQYNKDVANAQAAAYQVYLNSKLALETDDLAFRKAQQAFSETLSRAQLTGTYQGQPTYEAQVKAAELLGTYQGQPTLAAQEQQFAQGLSAAGLTGMYQGAPTMAAGSLLGTFQGQPTLAAQQQYWQQAFNQQAQQQKVVQDYLTLLSGLRGPQDYGQYLKVMASSPQGLQSLVANAAANQGRVPGFGTTGAPTQGATLGGFMGQAAGQGGTSYDQYMQASRGLPPPSQINPQNWNAMTDTQKQMLLGMYEQTGWNVTDALQQYQASLPKFGSTTPQTGQVRLV